MELRFINACEDGNLNLVQHLFYNNTINVSYDNEYAFRWTCRRGHLQIAQWLLSVKPDILNTFFIYKNNLHKHIINR